MMQTGNIQLHTIAVVQAERKDLQPHEQILKMHKRKIKLHKQN